MEQEMTTAPVMLISFLPLIAMVAMVGVTSHLLAREKGRNVALWTILGCIPFLNFLFIWFFVGAANLKLERKIDLLLQQQEEQV